MDVYTHTLIKRIERKGGIKCDKIVILGNLSEGCSEVLQQLFKNLNYVKINFQKL